MKDNILTPHEKMQLFKVSKIKFILIKNTPLIGQ